MHVYLFSFLLPCPWKNQLTGKSWIGSITLFSNFHQQSQIETEKEISMFVVVLLLLKYFVSIFQYFFSPKITLYKRFWIRSFDNVVISYLHSLFYFKSFFYFRAQYIMYVVQSVPHPMPSTHLEIFFGSYFSQIICCYFNSK